MVIGPPLEGPRWVDAIGCCSPPSVHRTATLPINGKFYVSERFAIDFAQLNPENKLYNGPRDQLSSYAYVGASTVITQDVPPFSRIVTERETKSFGANSIGLERHGFSAERVKTLQSAFRTLLRSKLNTSQAIAKLRAEGTLSDDVEQLIRFVEASERGVIK